MNLLNSLDSKKKEITDRIAKDAKAQNINAYIVGGVVRDLILGHKILDIDILVEFSAIEFVKKAGYKIKSLHEDFDTAKVFINETEIDIASTRLETYPNEGALPKVTKTGIKIEDDLKRRDFTVNAIAINIITGGIIDIFNGQKDIKEGVLRVLHDNSFMDDPTRILRGLDFKYRFNFEFCTKTKTLIKECIQNFNNENLSIERIYLTLNKIFSTPYSNKILKEILDNKIYKIWLKNTDLTSFEIEKLDCCASIFSVQKKSSLYIEAMEAPPFIKPPLKNDFEIYEFFKKFTPSMLALYYFKTEDKNAVEYLKLKDIKLNITGGTLIEMGYPQGKIIGTILNTLLKEKILHPNNFLDAKDELKFVKEKF